MTAAVPAVVQAGPVGRFRGSLASRILQVVVNAVIGVAAIAVAWQLLMSAANLTAYNRRGPLQIWRFLTKPGSSPVTSGTWPTVDAARHALFEATMTTLRDAGLGLVAGTIAGLVIAMLFTRWRVIEQGVMPIALALRAVPLIAMTPLIVLVFGRDLLGVTVISGIVTFFPTLVNVTLALRRVPASSVDLLEAYGASKGAILRRVQVPYALPALFASIRIAAPLALVGAYLAEYLATGKGLGALELTANYQSVYDIMWASIALTTFTAVLLYQLIAAIEQVVLVRFSDDPGSR
jgi:ABC-type nitrate/sulfonate/bicarbonate transport system permease component